MNKPIYDQNYIAFSLFDCLGIAFLIAKAARPGCRMAEIGSWLGNGSTQIFLHELRKQPGSSLVCIDTWQGNPNVARHQEIVAHYDVFATFHENVAKANSPVPCEPLRLSSLEAAPKFVDGYFDLVFIDADHSYKSVREDIAAWRNKVRPGGILCGHDCEARVSPDNQQRLIENRHADTIPGLGTPFERIHPGSILAVHESFDGKAGLMSEVPMSLPDGRAGRSSIWFVQVTGPAG